MEDQGLSIVLYNIVLVWCRLLEGCTLLLTLLGGFCPVLGLDGLVYTEEKTICSLDMYYELILISCL